LGSAAQNPPHTTETRQRAEKKVRKEGERAEFAGQARADLQRLFVNGLAEVTEAGKEVRR
jgi:hypothetical protein